MPRYLLLKLAGPMQAWGGHSYEDFRPSHNFPTRSGLLGLLAACLGVDRDDAERQQDLARSLEFTVRSDWRDKKPVVKLSDFHTVMDARKVDGKPNPYPVVSRREYLFDAQFTVAVAHSGQGGVTLEEVENALRKPVYTPFLGRRSCPLARPLFEAGVEAESPQAALAACEPGRGAIYGESPEGAEGRSLRIRDVPLPGRKRAFGNRTVILHDRGEEPCS